MSNLEVVCLAACPTLRASLRQILRHSRWDVCCCDAKEHALRELDARPRAVFVVDSANALVPPGHRTLVITEADEPAYPWLDVGAFDVLPRPLFPDEVRSLVSDAWRLSQHSRATAMAS